MRLASLLTLVSTLQFVLPAHANLCDGVKDTTTTSEIKSDVDFYESLFPDPQFHGSRRWNEIVVQCNRKRDSQGNQVARLMSASGGNAGKALLTRRELPPKVVRGHYNFFGVLPFRLNYVYVLSKSAGEWTMTIPYLAIVNDVAENRVDLRVGNRTILGADAVSAVSQSGPAWQFFERSQVNLAPAGSGVQQTATLRAGAQPIAKTLCQRATFIPGKADKYNGQNDANADKRDKENKFIDKGKIQYRYHNPDYVSEGCRVDEKVALFWQDPSTGNLVETQPQDWVLANFVRTVENYWTIPGTFRLRLLLRGRNDREIPAEILKVLETDDRLTIRFATKFLPYHYNQMYKSNVIQFNNFSTMTTDETYWHESGHAFGLDDEYGGEEDGKKLNDCHHADYTRFSPTAYQMCDTGTTERRTIYHYIAVSRYVTDQDTCDADIDCDGGYCDKGVVTVGKNQCVALKADNATCDIAGGSRQCASGTCSTYGRCYTKGAVKAGGTCYTDAACAAGKCSAIDGARGTCVCKSDSECEDGTWCNAGLDLAKNSCVPLKPDNATCDIVGGDHQCASGECSAYGRCYTRGAVPAGGTCYTDAACGAGKCSAIDGTRGTCVCQKDGDCGDGQWCDAGLDTKKNACLAKLSAGANCGKAGSVGNDHKCKSGQCSGFPKYECR